MRRPKRLGKKQDADCDSTANTNENAHTSSTDCLGSDSLPRRRLYAGARNSSFRRCKCHPLTQRQDLLSCFVVLVFREQIGNVGPTSHLQPLRNPFQAHRLLLPQSPGHDEFAAVPFGPPPQLILRPAQSSQFLLHETPNRHFIPNPKLGWGLSSTRWK